MARGTAKRGALGTASHAALTASWIVSDDVDMDTGTLPARRTLPRTNQGLVLGAPKPGKGRRNIKLAHIIVGAFLKRLP